MPTCLELANCPIDNPLDFIFRPFVEVIGPAAYVVGPGIFVVIGVLVIKKRGKNQ